MIYRRSSSRAINFADSPGDTLDVSTFIDFTKGIVNSLLDSKNVFKMIGSSNFLCCMRDLLFTLWACRVFMSPSCN